MPRLPDMTRLVVSPSAPHKATDRVHHVRQNRAATPDLKHYDHCVFDQCGGSHGLRGGGSAGSGSSFDVGSGSPELFGGWAGETGCSGLTTSGFADGSSELALEPDREPLREAARMTSARVILHTLRQNLYPWNRSIRAV